MAEHGGVRADIYFAQIPEWILFSKEVKHTDKCVWLVLQRFANENGVCWPGHAKIAELANMSKRQVIYSIGNLVAAGMLEMSHRSKKVESGDEVFNAKDTNVYRLIMLPPELRTSGRWTIVADDAPTTTLAGAESAPPSAEFALPPGAESALPPGAESAHKPEPKNNQSHTLLVDSCDADDSVADRSARGADAESAEIAIVANEAVAAPERADVEALCERLVWHLEKNGVRKQKTRITDTWKKQARLLLDNDEVPFDEAMRILDWCQNDPFWRTNILSMPKFRDKFDQLKLRAMSGNARHADSHAAAQRLRALADEAERIDGAQHAIAEGRR